MIGIITGLIQLIGRCVFKVNNEAITQSNRADAINNKDDIYFDSKGRMTKIIQLNNPKKDIKCYQLIDVKTGHDLLVNARDHTIIKDYTLEKICDDEIKFKNAYNEAKEKAIKNNKKFFDVLYLCGERGLDERTGRYELATEKMYKLSRNNTFYYIQYYKVTKYKKELDCVQPIDKDKYNILGGY